MDNSDLDKKITLASKSEIKAEQYKTVKFQALNSSYFCGKSHFEDDGSQNYLAFQALYRYFKKMGNSDHMSA